jgi:hypothetical protein
LLANRSVRVVEKVGMSAGRDQDMPGQQDIAFQMDQTQEATWPDIDVFFEDSAGLGKEGTELHQGRGVTVGKHLVQESPAEVLAADSRQQGEELGGGFQGAVRPEEEALEAVEQQAGQDQQRSETVSRGFEPTFPPVFGPWWCPLHVTILTGLRCG